MTNTRVGIATWYWALCLILPVGFVSLLSLVDRGTGLNENARVAQARWVISDSLAPPAEEADWSSWTTLPYPVSTHPYRSSVWYEIDLPPGKTELHEEVTRPWAIYAPEPSGNLTLFVDNLLIGGGGSRVPPVAHHRSPLLFSIPAALINTKQSPAQRVLIHRTHMDGRATLPNLYFGPLADFIQDHRRLTVLHFWVPLTILAFMLIMAGIMSVLFLLRRQDSTYGWYALTLVFWSVYQAWGVISTPLSENPYLWRAVSYASLGLFVSSSVFFVHRFLGRRHPNIEYSILVWSLLGVCLLFGLAAADSLLYVTFGLFIWVPVANGLGLYNIFRLWTDTLSRPTNERLCLLAVTIVVVVVGLRDFVWDLRIGLPGTTYYVGYAAGLVLLAFSLILMMRFSRALQEAENVNDRLTEEVRTRTLELEKNHERLRQVEQASAISEERERLMRDVHDGLGGQLVRMLSAAEQDVSLRPFASDLRHALQDLRLIIDSLAPNDGDLLSVLAAFRHHMEKEVNRAGIEFVWQVRDIPALSNSSPELVLNILRIVQESVTNTMKHANAQTIVFATDFDQDTNELILTLTDDGVGFDPSIKPNGRGIDNMHKRASANGGRLLLSSSAKGTTTEVRLPLD